MERGVKRVRTEGGVCQRVAYITWHTSSSKQPETVTEVGGTHPTGMETSFKNQPVQTVLL